MSWDERLFGWLWRGGRRLRAPVVSPEALARRASLGDVRDRLRVVAVAIAGRPLVLREAEAHGGIAGSTLLLPATLDLAPSREENESAFVLRVSLAATAVRLGLVLEGALVGPAEHVLATVLAMRGAREHLVSELPASEAALEALEARALAQRGTEAAAALEEVVRAALGAPPPSGSLAERVLSERPRSASELAALARAAARDVAREPWPAPVPLWGWLSEPDAAAKATGAGPSATATPRGTERVMRPRDHVVRKELGQRPEDLNPLVHSFEKLETLEEHKGGVKDLDGTDELDAHAEALEELDLREVIRSDEQTRSLLRSDAMLESGAGDLSGEAPTEGIPYDEWHEAARAFRPGWCRVRVAALAPRVERSVAENEIAALARRLRPRVDEVRAELLRIAEARRPRPRQLDGPEVDDDAMVDRHAALAAGATPPDRLYRARLRREPELSVLLLIDSSLSTDGWVEGQRVLDVERDAALVLGEALSEPGRELGLAAFSSHTRRDCRFHVLKGMSEPWIRARHRLASLEPAGYTRIGPALRHATATLMRTRARRRLLLLVTDGKPNDYDRYEGRYGVADVRHAVLEASSHGIHVHALAMDRDARFCLPQMFGGGGFTLLRSPGALAVATGAIVASMTR